MARRLSSIAAVAAGLVLGAAFVASDAAGAPKVGTVVSVVDGDTVRVSIADRTRTVHLAGVRASRATTCRGRLGRANLTRLLPKGRKVRVVGSGRRFPRARSFKAEVYLGARKGKRSVSRAQLVRGFAWVRAHRTHRSRYFTAYVQAEQQARRRMRGVWGSRCAGAPPNSGAAPTRGAYPVAPSPVVPAPGQPDASWPWQPAVPDPTKPGGVGLTLAAQGFVKPVYVTGRPGTADLIVVEQGGKIRISRGGSTIVTPFLDITSLVNQDGGERGLLGLAFHPGHAANGLFYVNYIDRSNATRIVEYYTPPGRDVATPESSRVLLKLPQPKDNHNAGHLVFGRDRMLYAALGDGGRSPAESQDLGTLLGSILRIDVSGSPYRVPADNPFTSTPGARGEIWAFGLRNPWRFSFDRSGDAMWIGDVGNDRREEINYRAAREGGANFGWNAFEGSLGHVGTLGTGPHVGPVAELDHSTSSNCSITGGYVYRGSQVPGLHGKYIFSDYCSAKLWTIDATNPGATPVELSGDLGATLSWVPSFGEDMAGELYVISGGGKIYRFTAR